MEEDGFAYSDDTLSIGTGGYYYYGSYYDNLSFHEGNFYLGDWNGNVYVYEGPEGSGALSFSSVEGVVAPGGSVEIGVGLNTSGMEPGEMAYDIMVDSNDPNNQELSLPLTFSILPQEISVTPESLTMALFSNEEGSEEAVTITNTGSYELNWEASMSDSSVGTWLSVSPWHGQLQAGSGQAVSLD